jgi:molybdopterin-binding protein
MISARNQFKGRVKVVKMGAVMAEVTIGVGELEFTALISRQSAENMKLQAGDEAVAVIKATEVMVAKE